jgi:hypothetical protein
MSFEDFHVPPRWALDCRRWSDGPRARRHGGLANARQAQIRAEERQQQIRAYARVHQCSQREAENELFAADDEE